MNSKSDKSQFIQTITSCSQLYKTKYVLNIETTMIIYRRKGTYLEVRTDMQVDKKYKSVNGVFGKNIERTKQVTNFKSDVIFLIFLRPSSARSSCDDRT